jgi:hypothetical protein
MIRVCCNLLPYNRYVVKDWTGQGYATVAMKWQFTFNTYENKVIQSTTSKGNLLFSKVYALV